MKISTGKNLNDSISCHLIKFVFIVMRPKLIIIENNLLSTLSMREKLVSELACQYDITILSTGNQHQMNQAGARGLRVFDIGTCKQNPFGVFKYISRIKKHLTAIQPDLVMTFTIRPAIWGNLVTQRMGIPTITTITGIGPLFSGDSFAYSIARIMYRWALRKTKRVFFQNEDDLKLFLENGLIQPELAAVVPGSGVDPEFFAPRKKSDYSVFRFLFIGRLVKDKGIHEFVEAGKILRSKGIDAEFQILGPFWSQNLKKNTVLPQEIDSWTSSGFIRYVGEADDVRPFIAEADCIVLPSYREGLNNVLLEACSMERPCISTDTTGCRNIVEHGVNGLLCQPRSIDSLADSMEEMFSMSVEKRNQMGRMGREKVMREFDKKIVIDIYRRALQENLS